jgi:hypothetical protein
MTVNVHLSDDAAEDLMVVRVACSHRFGQPYARRLTEPRRAHRAALRRHLEAGGGW